MERRQDYYRDFWRDKTTPLHRNNDGSTYEYYAKELLNLFQYLGYKNGKVLEIGCGNGALFPFFDFDADLYQGIDFSPSLINSFRDKYPHLSLIECDASQFIPNDHFDLIFGNAVHQHFSKKMLKKHINNMLLKLTDTGVLVLANLPYLKFKSDYFYGGISPTSSANKTLRDRINRRAFNFLKPLLSKPDNIGYWYSLSDIQNMISVQYYIEVYGSNFYPYRLHFCIKKNEFKEKI